MRAKIILQRNGLLVLALVALCITACRPKGILHSRQMRDVIIDLHKTEALMDEKGISRNNTEARSLYYAQVLEKHGITQSQFDSSLVWYTAHPQLFDKIYPRVLAQLEKEQEEFKAAHPELTEERSPDAQSSLLQETRPFTTSDLDSVLWVTLHSYESSWEQWERPFSMQDLIQ